MLDSTSGAEVLGSFAVIKLFVNQPPKWLSYENNNDNSSPFGTLVNKLISLLASGTTTTPSSTARENASLSLMRLTATCPGAVVPRLNALLAALMVKDPTASEVVRRSSIQTLLYLFDVEKVKLDQHIVAIVSWMTAAVDDPSETVGCAACDFWIKFCTGTRGFEETLSPHLVSILPNLVQVLVSKLTLPKKYALKTQSEMHDCSVPDENSLGGLIGDDEEESQNLRKSAAAALDALSSS
jgi:hypothetical protein